MKVKTSKAVLLGIISISFTLLTSLGAAVHAATRAPDIYEIDETLFPDPTFRQYVLDTIDEDKNGYLDAMERGQVTSIYLYDGYNGSKIYDLTGIEYFPSVIYLTVDKNELTELDLSNNINLEQFSCKDNLLKQLDLSACTSLTSIDCSNNQLVSLDLSANTNLVYAEIGTQARLLSPVITDTLDLTSLDTSIQENRIENLTGATLNGTVISDYVIIRDSDYIMPGRTKGCFVYYEYNTGNSISNTMDVTLYLDIQYSYLSFQDGNQEFTNWRKQGYTAPHLYVEGTELQLPTADDVEKEGYIFAGWYDNENFTGDPIDKIDATDTEDKIFYAKWEQVTLSETFTVTIPKSITLSGETKSGTYTVTCTGTIGDSRYISVEPDSSFTMTQKGKADVTATTVQQITKFRQADYTGSLGDDETEMGTDIEGTIHTPDLTAGSWNGTFNFRININ